MAIFRFERLLAGTAIAIALTAVGPAAHAENDTPVTSAVQSSVPVPDQVDVAPPSQSDMTGTTPVSAPSASAPVQEKAVESKPVEAKPTDRPMEAQAPEVKPEAPKAEKPKAAETTPDATTVDPKAAETKPAEAKPTEAAKVPDVKAPSVVVAGASAVTEKLRDAFAAKKDVFLTRNERSGAEAYYASRQFAPIWTTDSGPNDHAKAAIAYLNKIDADGLDPSDYPIPTFKAGMDPAALADAEMKLTASVLAYTRHATTGRMAYSRLKGDIFYALEAPEAKDVLTRVADARNMDSVLGSYEPQQPQYKALKAQLAKVRAVSKPNAGPAEIPPGPTLKFTRSGMSDPRVPALRERLGLPAKPGDTTYDKELAIAVGKFQKEHDINADGNAGNSTIAAINGPKHEHLADTLIVNMERWRWVPRDLGPKRVILNIPDFTLSVYNGDALVWKTKVVTGKTGPHATPLLSETMKYITVNPTWNVPPSIVYGEYLPALQQDPTVLDRMGFKLAQSADGGVRIWQPPGDGNALGRVRFNFPNKFLVYQHDTPDKNLFSRFPRAYSHGCMRVENPSKYAEVILSLSNPKDGYSQEKIKSMYGPSEIDIKLNTFIPVHITYQTAFFDDNGKLELRDDVYGHDANMIATLKGESRKTADIPVEKSQPSYVHPPTSLPAGVNGAYSQNNNGGNFFEMLFGGGNRQQNQPVATSRGRQQRQASNRPNRDLFSW